MTARPALPRAATPLVPGRVIAGAIVASAGVIAFSVAVGSFVVGSSHRLSPSTASQALALLADTPLFVGAGLIHLVVALALVAGRGVVQLGARVVTTAAALVAFGEAALIVLGPGPVGPQVGQPATPGLATLLIAGAAYAVAALAASPRDAD
jgi:hypothetical protein